MLKLSLFAFLAVFAIAPAYAVQLTKCVSKTGQITYTDGACPAETDGTSVGNFDRRTKRAPVAQNNGVVDPYAAVGGAPAAQGQTGAMPQQVTNDTAETSGYRCQTGTRVWIQRTPCPLTSEKTVSVPVSGTVIGTGEMVDGWADQRVVTPVDQQTLTKDQLCDQLRAKTATGGEKSKNGPSDAYDRNKMRQENSCY